MTSINDLPNELIAKVLSYLTGTEAMLFCLTSKRFYGFISHTGSTIGLFKTGDDSIDSVANLINSDDILSVKSDCIDRLLPALSETSFKMIKLNVTGSFNAIVLNGIKILDLEISNKDQCLYHIHPVSKSLKYLSLTSGSLSDNTFDFSGMPNLKSISLKMPYTCKLSQGIKTLKSCNNLKSISYQTYKVSEDTIDFQWYNGNKLNRLVLNNIVPDIYTIYSIKSLTHLEINCMNVDTGYMQGITYLQKLTNLKHLHINAVFDQDDIEYIFKKLTSLETLTLYNLSKYYCFDVWTEFYMNMQNLRELKLMLYYSKDILIKGLEQSTCLTDLSIIGRISYYSLEMISSPVLKKVRVKTYPSMYQNCDHLFLKSKNSLTYLDIDFCFSANCQIKSLCNLTKLEYLTVNGLLITKNDKPLFNQILHLPLLQNANVTAMYNGKLYTYILTTFTPSEPMGYSIIDKSNGIMSMASMENLDAFARQKNASIIKENHCFFPEDISSTTDKHRYIDDSECSFITLTWIANGIQSKAVFRNTSMKSITCVSFTIGILLDSFDLSGYTLVDMYYSATVRESNGIIMITRQIRSKLYGNGHDYVQEFF